MTPALSTTGASANPSLIRWTRFWTAAFLLVCFPAAGLSQAAGPLPPNQPAQSAPQAPDAANSAKPAQQPRGSDRRRAVKLYLASSKLFAGEQFEEAMLGFEQAATLDPANAEGVEEEGPCEVICCSQFLLFHNSFSLEAIPC